MEKEVMLNGLLIGKAKSWTGVCLRVCDFAHHLFGVSASRSARQAEARLFDLLGFSATVEDLQRNGTESPTHFYVRF